MRSVTLPRRMLLLLPPSEGKTSPPRGRPADLARLPFADVLGPIRGRILDALDPTLRGAPAIAASRVYTGVLFARLDLPSIPAAARRRVLIASGLWGLVRPGDRIPAYKLPIEAKVDGLGGLPALWRPAIAQALAPADRPRTLVVDARSGGYASVWRPRRATHVAVRAFRVHPDGTRQPISHMAKAARGDVARALLLAPRAPRTPDDVAAAVAAAGLEAELAGSGAAWTLDVLERAPA